MQYQLLADTALHKFIVMFGRWRVEAETTLSSKTLCSHEVGKYLIVQSQNGLASVLRSVFENLSN